MIKSAVLLFLLAASANAFAPVPALTPFGRNVISVASTRHVMFMASPITEEKTENAISAAVNGESEVVQAEKEEELSETQKLMKKVKESGTAGIVSYALWELAFWFVSVPVCIFGYREVAGYVCLVVTSLCFVLWRQKLTVDRLCSTTFRHHFVPSQTLARLFE